MYEIKSDKQLEILRWLLGSLDNQWLIKTSAAYGAGESLKISTKARSSLGKVEMKAMLALLGKSQAGSVEDALDIIKAYLGLAYGERGWDGSFKLNAGAGGSQRVEIKVTRCTVLDNLKKVGAGAGESLALACEMLWNSWFETLLPGWQVETVVQFGSGQDVYVVTCYDEEAGVGFPVSDVSGQVAQIGGEATESTYPPVTDYSAYTPTVSPSSATGYTYQPATPSEEVIVNPATSAQRSGNRISFQGLTESDLAALAPSQPPAESPAPEIVNRKSEIVNPPPGRTLGERLANKQKQATPPPATPPPPPASSTELTVVQTDLPLTPGGPALAPVPATIFYDENGRPLFSGDTEKEAKEAVEERERERKRSNKLMNNLFLSKKAREMIEEGKNAPPSPNISVAAGIQQILQKLLVAERQTNPNISAIHVGGTPEGDLVIVVGPRTYSAITDVPASRERDLLQQAAQQWSDGQNR